MYHTVVRSRLVWVGLGVVAGILSSGLLPQAPLHAMCAERFDTFAIATGPLDEEVEAIYFLDFLTGDLRAAAINPRLRRFNAFFQLNILQAMGVDVSKNPKFLMITGMMNMRRGAGPQWGNTVAYIAEANSGMVGAFATPWPREYANAGKMIQAPLVLLDVAKFRTAAVREGAQ